MPSRSFHRAVRVIVAPLAMCLSVLTLLTVWLDSSSAHAQAVSANAPADITDVSAVDFAFEPATITITAGSTVRWTRSDTSVFTHTTTSDTGIWDSGDLAPGGSFTHTFDTPGIYLYHCAHHPAFMQGVVIVLAAQPPTAVTIDGPVSGSTDTAYTFTASVEPLTATQPITYVWQAANQTDIVHQAGLSDTVVFTWSAGLTGTQWITATASNAYGSSAGTHFIILSANQVYLPLIMR